MKERRKSRKIKIRDTFIGEDAPVLVQSMTNTPTKDVNLTLKQIRKLEEAGCELVRCGVPDMESAKALGKIIKKTQLPICADIHFDASIAREAIRQGIHKLRINPGNLRNKKEVKELAIMCRDAGVPIRIGVNAGSLDPSIHKKYGRLSPEALVESAMNEVTLLEECNFFDIVISIKASSVPLCVESYRMIAEKCNYPLHIGITEAGTLHYGTIKSSVGLGILLYEGIGDTLRVSLTADPVDEVRAAWDILKALEIRRRGPELISCPTCTRTEIDVIKLASLVEEKIKGIPFPMKIAVMGCVVNGPGEAKEANVGIAGGKGKGVVFRSGEKVRVVDESHLVEALMEEIDFFIKNYYNS